MADPNQGGQPPVTSQPAGQVPVVQYAQPGYQHAQPGYQQGSGYAPPPGYAAPQQGYGTQPPGYAPPQQGFGQAGMPGQPGLPPGTQVMWMARPEPIPGCPPGLEYLSQVDQLLVQQQVEILEMFTGWESKNKYVIRNSVGQQVYFATEESDACMRQCCGPSRGFIIHITDNLNQEVIRVTREFKCCAGCCWCANTDHCAFQIAIESPPGQVVGYVRQQCSGWTPHYSILDAAGDLVLNIRGPCCIMQGICCTWDQEFHVFSKDWGSDVGKISKQWSGLLREMYTDADNFGVSFPMDLDVKMKAVLVGAVFLIDFMFFEQKQNNNR